jgi:broad specificity phosphatase PhoE
MNIVFCRHGETEFNLFDRYQGVSDSPLTEHGKDQARKINIFLKANFHVEAFYISPLHRVQETFELASAGISAPVIVVQELHETCFGNWETRRREEIDPALLEEKERDRFNYVHPGEYNGTPGESYKMTEERVIPFLESLEKSNHKGDIVVICHQGVMVGIHDYYLNLDDKDASKYKNSNHQVMVVSIESGVKTVEIKDLDKPE